MDSNPIDSLIKKELQKWIEKNAEKIAKEIINEQAKKSLNSPKFDSVILHQ